MIGFQDVLTLQPHAVGVALGSTGDKAIFRVPPGNWDAILTAVAIEGTSSHATQAVATFDKRVLAGSDTGRVDAFLGTFTKPAANVQGNVYYGRPLSKKTLTVGMEVVFEVTVANGDAVAATPYVLVRDSPEAIGNLSKMVAHTGLAVA